MRPYGTDVLMKDFAKPYIMTYYELKKKATGGGDWHVLFFDAWDGINVSMNWEHTRGVSDEVSALVSYVGLSPAWVVM